jgi:hypothetical protein
MDKEKELTKKLLPAFRAMMGLLTNMSYADIGLLLSAVTSEIIYECDPDNMDRRLTELMVYTKKLMAKRKKMGDCPPQPHLEDE